MSAYGLEIAGRDDAQVAVELSGELDLTNAAELELRLDEAAPPGDSRLVLDLNRVSYIDSAALHVLFKLARRRGRDGLAVVVEPDAPVARTLAIVGLDRAVTVAPSLHEGPLPAEHS